MKLIPIIVAGLGIFSATHALSAAVTLDFEDQFSFSSVSYGPNAFGVAANGALLALANDGTGPGASGEFFSNTPTGGAVVMFATAPLSGERAEITVANGFVDAVNFFYSSTAAATVYARDAAGAVLGSVSLLANSTSSTSPYDTWSLATLTFSGPAYSIDFGDTVGVAAIDDVTVNAVPLPAAALLFPFGAAALGWAGRRKSKQA